ncbi:UBP48-like protein [Mya arenaria]|uniref:ubiquitinyl hydrolase 1 n=1 Tax=Mya arenaria TaxID=6604 RepID=A0ABY7FVM3_MYAAR|nr:ubiquitin carboxyl-terminal hydrolase 48-like [Mya arenaria]XP_052782109.1 ubiquitin carboxyl-terminal hydrolase 48-like [Mya arenaria]WAR25209.1 UBP48-like protein [Mya arenaria]
MPTKPTLDKLSWQWAETTDPENVSQENIRTAYRLNLPVCKLGVCKRHCKGNPFCINCIGEKVWFGKIDDSSWHDIQDPTDERRRPGMSVGLKNLGATCYVNTFLQLWFQNENIRKGVYEWREMGADLGDPDSWEPTSVCSHLQVIFGLLEMSYRRYVDPSEFIKHLGLDAGQQQDAQEFSKLFLSVLEQNLAEGASLHSSNIVKEQLCGKYAYVTRCSKCGMASERLSEFYELDLNIQGHKTLNEAMKGFLEEEKLEGDNQYMCSMCNCKQDASRAIELKKLPPVLNLQLLRFVFDIKTGSKKKLNSCIQFPDVLDMSEFMPPGVAAMYELNAVLIHRGPSAYSGHYVAHIKSKDSQAWYKFNDEEVEKIKGKSLQLGSEEDLETKKQKSVKAIKGHHASKNAYMLVYTLRSNESKIDMDICDSTSDTVAYENGQPMLTNENVNNCCSNPSNSVMERNNIHDNCSPSTSYSSQPTAQNEIRKAEAMSYSEGKGKKIKDGNGIDKSSVMAAKLLPANVVKYIEKDNAKFENWILEMDGMREENIAKGQEKQETVKAIYQDLAYVKEDGNKYEWLPMSWFGKWLNDPATAPEIDVTKLCCAHQKASPEMCLKMKCVSQRGADHLFSIYGGSVRLQGDESLCEICVKNRCNLIRTKIRINEDDKFISSLMKKGFPEEHKLYWIGKRSYRSWKRLAVEQLNAAEQKHAEMNSAALTDEENDSNDNVKNEIIESNDHQNEEQLCIQSDSVENNIRNMCEISASDQSIHATENSSTENNKRSPKFNPTKSKSAPSVSNTDYCSKQSENNDHDDCVQFNEDLLCDVHSGLDPDPTCRKLVPECVWSKLKRYFPDCPEFELECGTCEKCMANIVAENKYRDENKHLASVQKACLVDLFYDRKRPANINPNESVYIVSGEFIDNWRKFIKDPVKNDPLPTVVNSILLCKHGGFLYPPDEIQGLKSDSKVVYVTADEWQIMKDLFTVDCEITKVCMMENDSKTIETFPKVCDDCLQMRLCNEEGELYEYERGMLYIRKQLKQDMKGVSNMLENNDSSTDDPEFGEKVASATNKKRGSTGLTESYEPPEKCSKTNNNSRMVRKSQRHRKMRGEKEVTISSKDTLKDLKLEIMRLFSVPPFDQNLFINGRLLEDNTKSLFDLRVASGSVVDLIADEPNEEMTFLEDFTKETTTPESGFKGTNLLKT